METCRAVRGDRWKYVHRHPAGPHELYDMQSDAQERFNLLGQPGMQPVVQEMSGRLEAFFQTYADPQYDLLHGGRSKAKRVTGE
jgi:arylsulfatase A-like enzyme